jgi:ribosomal protein S18 acetylase RimI-like enzyme
MDAIDYREATSSDAAALGRLHVASWREAYAGILPDHLLNGFSVKERSAMWEAILNKSAASGGTAVFVAEGAAEIVGFGACGSQRDAALRTIGFEGEVGAIYVRRSYQRACVGSSLMSLMSQRLLDQGWKAAALWVMRDNSPARKFYERLGGAVVGERSEDTSG